MDPPSKDYNDDNYDIFKREKKHSIIIKDGYPELSIITGEALPGTSLTVSSITLNTSCLNNECIKIDFASNIFSIDFNRTIIFRVLKFYDNQSTPTPVRPEWTFSTIGLTQSRISFFVFDSDCCNNEWCTYKVVATIE